MENTEDHFSLKWSNFRSSLTEGFHDFFREEMMVDVTLAAEGKFVQAHKLVLSVCSSYFKNLFKVNPCKHPIVILKDVGHNELSHMLQFMYKGEVGVKHDDLPSFLKLADMLKVKGLVGETLEKGTFSRIESTLEKIGKKRKVEDEPESTEKSKEKRMMKNKKRRFSARRGTGNKSQKEKLDICESSGNVSDSEDENPLVKFVSDTVECSDSFKNDEQCAVKNGFSECEDDNDDGHETENNDGGGHPDEFSISPSFFPPDNLAETEQTPQEVLSVQKRAKSVRTSLIWKYFIKYPAFATCRLCGRNFKGFRPHTSIECHLKTRHYRDYLDFTKNREEQRKRLARDQFGDFFSRFYGMTNYNFNL